MEPAVEVPPREYTREIVNDEDVLSFEMQRAVESVASPLALLLLAGLLVVKLKKQRSLELQRPA